MPLDSASPAPDSTVTQDPGGFFRQSLLRDGIAIARTFAPEGKPSTDEGYVTQTFGFGRAWLCAVELRPMGAGNLWRDGRHMASPPMTAGGLHLHDARHSWASQMHDAFDCVIFRIPEDALDAETRPRGGSTELAVPTFDPARVDPVMLHLARAILPALSRPREASALFLDHVTRAAAAHVAASYGSQVPPRPVRGRLSPHQVARVVEYVQENLASDIPVRDLAALCDLSPGHFSHAFRETLGFTAHRWLTARRVTRAEELLRRTGLKVSDIAQACGFADQSHLTRVLRAATGRTPLQLRRESR